MWNTKKVVGIIAEFNPMHDGHKYLIERARSECNADVIIAVMSGNFVQRGEPAIIEKKVRAKIAIDNGVDIVIENPVACCTSNMQDLISSAITILDEMKVVDNIVFSSECGSLEFLEKIAICMNSSLYHNKFYGLKKDGLKSNDIRNELLDPILSEYNYQFDINQPNNLVASYIIKELFNRDSKIRPIAFKRIGSDYFSEESKFAFYSATSLRKILVDRSNVLSECSLKIPGYLQKMVDEGYEFLSFEDIMCFAKSDVRLKDISYLSRINGYSEIDIAEFIHMVGCETTIHEKWEKKTLFKRFLIRSLLGISDESIQNTLLKIQLTRPIVLESRDQVKNIVSCVKQNEESVNSIYNDEIQQLSDIFYFEIKNNKRGAV